MEYMHRQVMEAFRLYTELANMGEIRREEAQQYFADDIVRELLEKFAGAVQCTLIHDKDKIYLLPIAQSSPFHISNDTFKRLYMPSRAVNLDIYMMYLAMIILFGKFYDSYQSMEPADFLSIESWLAEMNERLSVLSTYDKETLQAFDQEYQFNWSMLLEKWEDMDDIKETVKKQDSRTVSRVSLLNMTKEFLERQGLVEDIGANELQLTEKARNIICRYYMAEEYNQGILEFIYQFDRGGKAHAGN